MKCCICLSKLSNQVLVIQCQQCQQYCHFICYQKWVSHNNDINKCPHCMFITVDPPIPINFINEDDDNSNHSSSTDEEIEERFLVFNDSNHTNDLIQYRPRITRHQIKIAFYSICSLSVGLVLILFFVFFGFNSFPEPYYNYTDPS